MSSFAVVLIEAGLIGVMGSFIGALLPPALGHQNVTVLIAQQTGWTFAFSLLGRAFCRSGLCVVGRAVRGIFPGASGGPATSV